LHCNLVLNEIKKKSKEEISMPFMKEMLPETSEAFDKLRDTIFNGGEIDRKSKELIAVACSVLMRCQFCVHTHSQRAISHGASKKEIAEAISIAMFIAAGTQLGWTNDLGKSAYDLIFEEKKSEEPNEGKGCSCGQ
jgi:AhpD family alkylhydroperoxidase